MRGYRGAEERARRPSFYPTAPPRPPQTPPGGRRGLPRRPARGTRNFFAWGESRALGFWDCGEAVPEPDAGLEAHPSPWPAPRTSPAGGAQAARRIQHHVRRLWRTDTRSQLRWKDKRGQRSGWTQRGMARQGQCDQTHHDSDELTAHVTISQLAAGNQRKEKADVTPQLYCRGRGLG